MSRAIAAIWGSHSTDTPWQPFGSFGRNIATFWRGMTRDAISSYRPEKHYMRGPGPAWQAKYGHLVKLG
jgi:hypothetical protein